MSATEVIQVTWMEDSTNTVLGRVVARDGTGSATGVNGEGNWIKKADLSSITCSVFDLSSAAPTTAITTPTVTISTDILDTPVTSNVIWTEDKTGYNFLIDLAAANFPTGEHVYSVRFTFTTTGGDTFNKAYEGLAEPTRVS